MDHILGRKVGMTQIFLENGSVVPVTVIQAGPCFVTAIRTAAKDGYEAVQVAFDPVLGRATKGRPGDKGRLGQSRFLSRPRVGYLQKRNLAPMKVLREFRESGGGVAVGDAVNVSIFNSGDFIDVTGTTKGKGFQGGVRRYNFRGGPKTHGQSDRHRAPGSIGSGTTPGRVFKGTRMAGHMGHVRHTVLNLQVVGVDAENNVLLVKGAVPGSEEGLVIVRRAVKKQAAH